MHIQTSLLHSHRNQNETTNPTQVFQLNPWLSYTIQRYILVWIKYVKKQFQPLQPTHILNFTSLYKLHKHY